MDVNQKAWVVTVDMGYGHQRTADNLRLIAPGSQIINANRYADLPASDEKTWKTFRGLYELISVFKQVPLVGSFAFSVFDAFQRVPPFYPKRDLSRPSLQLRQIYFLLKNGWGKHLIGKLNRSPLPLVSTFFIPAFMAEFFGYTGEIFCVVCDTDISRTWAPLEPKTSRIKYFAPTERVVERLKLYGVKAENIFLTGYPLPPENVGDERMEILRNDLKYRLLNLDPRKRFAGKYGVLIEKNLGELPSQPNHPLTLLFAVGGAGAQKEIAAQTLQSLVGKIKAKEIRLLLAAGVRENVRDYFQNEINRLGLASEVGKNIRLLFSSTMESYFREFNLNLRQTDVLWTKPSELSFYAALGIPLIVAPTVGSHEEFNKRWLLNSNFGVSQKDPRSVADWLFDLVEQGHLAEKALQGFVKGEKSGAIKIQKIVEERLNPSAKK